MALILFLRFDLFCFGSPHRHRELRASADDRAVINERRSHLSVPCASEVSVELMDFDQSSSIARASTVELTCSRATIFLRSTRSLMTRTSSVPASFGRFAISKRIG